MTDDLIYRADCIAAIEAAPNADDAIALIRALPAADTSALGAVVKPLVWVQCGSSYRAPAPLFGNIRVENYSTDYWSVHWSAPGFTDLFMSGAFRTPEEAKAAAQANYTARILAALEPPTHADLLAAALALPEVAAMVEDAFREGFNSYETACSPRNSEQSAWEESIAHAALEARHD